MTIQLKSKSDIERKIPYISKIYFQNMQAAHITQCQKNKQPNQKVGKGPKQTFLQRRHTDG